MASSSKNKSSWGPWIPLGVILAILLLKDFIAGAALAGGIKAITGLDAQVGSVHVALLKQAVRIRNVRVMNPSGFPDRVMLDLPELYVDYKVLPLLMGTAHLEEVRLNLQEFNVVKAADGRLNLDAITALKSDKPAAQGAPAKKPAGPPMKLQIDLLELNVGKVVYRDHTKSPATVREFPVEIHERYEHINNPYLLAGLIVSRSLMKTTVANLANFDVSGLQAGVQQALKASAGELTATLKDGATAAGKIGRDAAGAASDAVDKTAGTLKKLLR